MKSKIWSRFVKGEKRVGGLVSPDTFYVCVDNSFYEEFISENYRGIAKSIAERIADEIYPQIEKIVMDDPTFKDRIINEVLIMLANKVADKKLQEKNETGN